MASKIETLDNVQNSQWGFVNQKKESIKKQTQKDMNSEFYLTFSNPAAPFCYLFFALAPLAADSNANIEGILNKLRGQTEEQNRQFENCRKNLLSHWDKASSLPDAIRRNRNSIVKAGDDLEQVSSRITFDEGKQLLKGSLNEEKVCVDYHTNNGSYAENVVNGTEYVNNYASIIFQESSHKYLVAFLSRSDKSEPSNKAQTFVDRPIPEKVQNPDDRPLPSAEKSNQRRKGSESESRPSVPRKIINPDDKYLNPPITQDRPRRGSGSNVDDKQLPQSVEGSYKDLSGSKPQPTAPRQILNPDQKLLVPPPPVVEGGKDQQTNKRGRRKSSGSDKGRIGDKARQLGRKVEQKVEDAVDDLKHSKTPWVQIAIAGVIIGLAIKIIRG